MRSDDDEYFPPCRREETDRCCSEGRVKVHLRRVGCPSLHKFISRARRMCGRDRRTMCWMVTRSAAETPLSAAQDELRAAPRGVTINVIASSFLQV